MKNQTKIKIAAVAAGFTLATFIGTIVLVNIENPAQWAMAAICILSLVVAGFVGASI